MNNRYSIQGSEVEFELTIRYLAVGINHGFVDSYEVGDSDDSKISLRAPKITPPKQKNIPPWFRFSYHCEWQRFNIFKLNLWKNAPLFFGLDGYKYTADKKRRFILNPVG